MSEKEKVLSNIKEMVLDMMSLVINQHLKTIECFRSFNSNLAEEIIHIEQRINSLELSIDRYCEKVLALHSPVAVELRFIMSVIKINIHIERIGDHAKALAEYITQQEAPFDKKLLDKAGFYKMYDLAMDMMDVNFQAFNEESEGRLSEVFGKDAKMNSFNRNATSFLIKKKKQTKKQQKQNFYIFSSIRKLERIGDLSKNIAEEIIFYLKAKVLRHTEKEKTHFIKQNLHSIIKSN